MTRFNIHEKSGFSFIEIIFCFALLAIFGTSLFTTQSNLFSKVFSTHQQLIAYLKIQPYQEILDTKMYESQENKKNFSSITYQETKDNLSISIKVTPLSEKSSLFKTFKKRINIIKITATFDNKTDSIHTFIFQPVLKESKDKGST